MTTQVEQRSRASRAGVSPLRLRIPAALLPIALLVMLYFCQMWGDVAGFTVRSEDLLILILLGNLLLAALWMGKLRYYRNPLNVPLLLWCGVLLLGVALTLISPFDSVTKKDALVNGIRLVLSIGVFFIVQSYPASAGAKQRMVISVVLGFSLVTTVVSLLQVAYSEGMPLPLPPLLIEKAPGSNMAPGREVFALFVGDTGTHTWAGMLALQALLVFVYARRLRRPVLRWTGWGYFVLLTLLLVRTAVRNSLLGLLVAVVGLSILHSCRPLNLLLKISLYGAIGLALMLGAAYFQSDSYFVQRAFAAVPRFVDGQLVVSRASNVYGRLDYYRAALQLFLQRPLTGYGFYSYQALSGRYLLRPIVNAHNSYLQTLAELGIIGAVSLSWLILRVTRFLARTRRCFGRQDPGALWWEFATGSFILLAFSMLFANSLGEPNYVGFRMIVLGILAHLARERVE